MTPEKKWPKFFLILAGIFVVGNLLYLNYYVFLKKGFYTQKNLEKSTQLSDFDEILSTDQLTIEEIETLIFEATQSMTFTADVIEDKISVDPSPTTAPKAAVVEYYIPLGTGSANSTSWVELPGIEAYVAPSNYGTITGLYFEASLRIPTGNGTAYARLKNVTDSVSLFESEVARAGESAGLVSSGNIPLPKTTKLYRVEMKSSLGATAHLDSARIKIFVQNQ